MKNNWISFFCLFFLSYYTPQISQGIFYLVASIQELSINSFTWLMKLFFWGGNSHFSEYEVFIEQYILFFDKLFQKEVFFVVLFCFVFQHHSQSSYSVPGSVLGIGNIIVKMTGKIPGKHTWNRCLRNRVPPEVGPRHAPGNPGRVLSLALNYSSFFRSSLFIVFLQD